MDYLSQIRNFWLNECRGTIIEPWYVGINIL